MTELQEYLGSRFDPERAEHHRPAMAEDWRRANPRTPAEILDFYRSSEGYLYNLTGWHGEKERCGRTAGLITYAFRHGVTTVLDYGCGIGEDGLWLAEAGCCVTFADVECPSLEYLRWRIRRRGLESQCRVEVLDGSRPEVPGHWDLGICLDVLEHLVEPLPVVEFLTRSAEHLSVRPARSDALHPMHLPQNDALAEGELDRRLAEAGFERSDEITPWFYARRQPAPAAPPLGLGVITCNRLAHLQACVEGLRSHTRHPYQLVIADDGSHDGSVEWARQQGCPVITGPNRGVAWNKNRALHYFASLTRCDPLFLIEDDSRVWEDGWETEWVAAARRWGQVNWTPDREIRHGQGAADNPWRTLNFGGQCTVTTRETLQRVGYLDTRFVGYGGGHVEWTRRVARAYAERWGPEPEKVPCLTAHLGALYEDSSFHSRRFLTNRILLERLLASGEPLYRPPWRSPEECEQLSHEVLQAASLPDLAA